MLDRGAETGGPILIVGCRRSGTTLLRTILEGHPDLLVHPDEPQFFLELHRKYGFSRMSAKLAIAHTLNHPYRAPNICAEAFSGAGAKLDLIELAELYLKAWRAGQDEKRPVLKDPLFVFHLDTASKLFPGCKVINIVRDPRGNVSSQRLRWPQFSVWTCAMYWRNAVQAAATWGAQHPQRFLTVSYEALVKDPQTAVRKLCEALYLPYTDALLSFRQKEVIFEADGGQRTRQFTAPDPSRQDLWKQRLSMQDIRLVETCCAREMAFLGYEPVASSELSASLQRRRLREQIAYYFYKFGKRTKNIMRRLGGQLQVYFSSR